jgi:hypothetical protein
LHDLPFFGIEAKTGESRKLDTSSGVRNEGSRKSDANANPVLPVVAKNMPSKP